MIETFINYLILDNVSTLMAIVTSLLIGLNLATLIFKIISFRKFNALCFLITNITVIIINVVSIDEILLITIISLLYIYYIIDLIMFIIKLMDQKIIKQKIEDHIKNDTTDFYISMDNKNKVIDYSSSFAQITKLNKKEIIGKSGWDIIFKEFDIRHLNDEEFITSNANLFLSHLDEAVSKYKMYQFTMDLKNKDHQELLHYVGLIHPIYRKDKKIATALYLYCDKISVISKIKTKLDKALSLLENHKNVLHILMSLSEGVSLYYDYQEKLFYATESFKAFTEMDKDTYTFQEFYHMIAPDDIEQYNIQSETVNSLSVTRIKFRLLVKNIYFNAIEDSIYLTKSGEEYVSIIHILSRSDEAKVQGILSTKDTCDMIDNLSKTPVAPLVYDIEEVLENSLKEDLKNDK